MPKPSCRTVESLINELKTFDLNPFPLTKQELTTILPIIEEIGRMSLILERFDNELNSQLELIEALADKLAGNPKPIKPKEEKQCPNDQN